MVVDELQRYVNSYEIPFDFKECLLRGGKYGLDMIVASQQPNLIHNSIRSSVSDFICFGQGDVNAVKYAERFGIEGISMLKPLEFFWYKIGEDRPKKYKLVFKPKAIEITPI